MWPSVEQPPYKGPIRHLQRYLSTYDKKYSLELTDSKFSNIQKWISDTNIDNDTLTNFCNHLTIIDSQRTCILKFKYNQYMGIACKQLFFEPILYPHITCFSCNSLEPDAWKHVLLSCVQPHIHALRIKRNNKVVWKIKELIFSYKTSKCYILMNVWIYNSSSQDNTVPTWLLPCTCNTSRCYYNAQFKPDSLCIKGIPYQHQSPTHPTINTTIQLIEFTYYNDKFYINAIANKLTKY